MMSKKRIRREKRIGRKARSLSAEEILRLMEEEDRPLLIREVLRLLRLPKDQRQKVREIFRDLADEGKIVKIRGNRYGFPEKMNLVVGRVKCHPDGYGFVIPEAPGEEDVFLSPRNLREAMHGDRVVVRVESVQKKGQEGRAGSFTSSDILMIQRWNPRSSFTNTIFPSVFQRRLRKRREESPSR